MVVVIWYCADRPLILEVCPRTLTTRVLMKDVPARTENPTLRLLYRVVRKDFQSMIFKVVFTQVFYDFLFSKLNVVRGGR